ncbi:MAG: hypothetical protein LBD64_04580 [Odoribacteraceae bacterium]|nr:hypothetical protein [Odoribacteraceae bacterium]
MRTRIYIIAWATMILVSACSSTSNFARVQEDDIYYVPGEQSLYAQEHELQTGQTINTRSLPDNQYTPVYNRENENITGVNENARAIGMARYATRQQVERAEAINPGSVEIIPVPGDDGYWMGGFHGSEYDLQECVRIMNRYPEGFALFGNGYEIALNLSFNSDWNVFTLDNRYWWFPSSSNIDLYSKFLFGVYPDYVMTISWNDPRFDFYAFDHFYNVRWRYRGAGWNMGFGGYWGYDRYWGYYDPWYYSSWYHDPFWHYPRRHDRWYHDHYYDNYYRDYHAGERSNYVSRHVNTGRRNATYYNNRASYTTNRTATSSSSTNRTNANARTTYSRENNTNRNNNARTGSATSTYTRNANQTTTVTPVNQGSSSSTNARSNYTRTNATPANTNSSSSSTNTRNNAYRQSNTSSSSNNSSSTTTRQSNSSSSSSSSSSYSRSSSSSSGSSSSGSSSSYSRSSSSGSSSSSGGSSGSSSGSSSSRTGRR